MKSIRRNYYFDYDFKTIKNIQKLIYLSEEKRKMNKKLADKILKMVKMDQAMRKNGKWDKSIDKKNTSELKKIIKKYGWPNIALVGKKASHGAWLLAQHADHDLVFQKKCLKLMHKELKSNNILPEEIAYLTDRILVNKGRPQLYGTQFYLNKDGKLIPRPVKNRKGLNKKRKRFGLESFSKYRKCIIGK